MNKLGIYRRLLGAYCDLLLLMTMVLFWTFSRAFAKRVEEADAQHCLGDEDKNNHAKMVWFNLNIQFRELKKLGKIISQIYGTISTIFMLTFIVESASAFNEIFDTKYYGTGFKDVFNVTFYCTSSLMILIIAADVSRQVSVDSKGVSCRR